MGGWFICFIPAVTQGKVVTQRISYGVYDTRECICALNDCILVVCMGFKYAN